MAAAGSPGPESSEYSLTHEEGGEEGGRGFLVFKAATSPATSWPECDITKENINSGELVYMWQTGDAFRVINQRAYCELCRLKGLGYSLSDPFTRGPIGKIYQVKALVRDSEGHPVPVDDETRAKRLAAFSGLMGGGAAASSASVFPTGGAAPITLESVTEALRQSPVFRVAASALGAAGAAAGAAGRFVSWLGRQVQRAAETCFPACFPRSPAMANNWIRVLPGGAAAFYGGPSNARAGDGGPSNARAGDGGPPRRKSRRQPSRNKRQRLPRNSRQSRRRRAS